MKRFQKYFPFLVAGLLLMMGLAFTSADNAPAEPVNLRSLADLPDDAPSGSVYTYAFTADTITNTEADVLTIPTVLISKWTYNWTISTTQLSGTQNLSCQISESNTRTGTDWLNVGSAVTTSGATDLDRVTGEIIYGLRQRLTITGSGTQSTRYVVTVTLKKD